MGLRGAHSAGNPGRSSTDYTITPQAIAIYRRMRALDRQCQCLSCSDDPVCPACEEWWQLNGELNAALGVGPIAWLPAYEAPDDECERDYTPKQSGRDRFFQLERASRAAGKPKRLYKWER